MGALREEIDSDAECRRLRVAIFRLEQDSALAALRAVNREAQDALHSVPAKFGAPFLALMQIAQDAERKLLAGKQPRTYWVSDEAETLKYVRATERLGNGVPIWKA